MRLALISDFAEGARGARSSEMAMVQNQWYHVGIGAPPILVYFSGDWDVHWGYGVLTQGQMARQGAGERREVGGTQGAKPCAWPVPPEVGGMCLDQTGLWKFLSLVFVSRPISNQCFAPVQLYTDV